MVFILQARAQSDPGVVTGNLLDTLKKAVAGASVELIPFTDSTKKRVVLTDRNGAFNFQQVSFGYYHLRFSFVGYQPLVLDSIYFRKDRFDFNLDDIVLKTRSSAENLQEVVIYAEKPLIQSKDGNITFNAGESALSASSNASELLQNVPLVSKDPDGKINVRGKEPKILIDDKPVELNLQQLQDLLESMPGSSIERIEVMTNPPPQYANEQGGVINIITKKGRVGMSGRISMYGGTRGDAGMNGSFTYRKKKLAININAGGGYNRIEGSGYSIRQNMYADSSNFFNTINNYLNKNIRPNFRANIDYDISKLQLLNVVLQYNQNDFDNHSITEYRNINRLGETYRLSDRDIKSTGDSYSPSLNASYTLKGKKGQALKLISGLNISSNGNARNFYQEYFNPDHSPTGADSTQEQLNHTNTIGSSIRASYDLPLSNKKTFLSFGSFYTRSDNHVKVDASYFKKPDNVMVSMPLLSNDFKFHQSVANLRGSLRQLLGENFSFTAGANVERTDILFELFKEGRDVRNHYFTWMPFANINRNWHDKLNLTLSYRRTIRRPVINELNPAIDFSDPYNVRFGNPNLVASTAHNFDLVFGRTRSSYFMNLAFGYNIVQDIFSQVRTLLPDSKTQITWENISGRKEYELSSWNGLTVSKKLRINLSASYTYSTYSEFDRTVRRYRNGGSFTSSMNGNYTPKDVWNINGSFTLNRFASPQGFARWSTGMNLGIQRKLLQKRFTITLNIIDPFRQQQTRVFTFGPDFSLESFSSAQTRNFRLSLSYNIDKKKKNR
jgi:outer membrane receptor protein involved in Fe transport